MDGEEGEVVWTLLIVRGKTKSKRMVTKQIMACQVTVLIYVIYLLLKTTHFYRSPLSGDAKTYSVKTKGKCRKQDL